MYNNEYSAIQLSCYQYYAYQLATIVNFKKCSQIFHKIKAETCPKRKIAQSTIQQSIQVNGYTPSKQLLLQLAIYLKSSIASQLSTIIFVMLNFYFIASYETLEAGKRQSWQETKERTVQLVLLSQPMTRHHYSISRYKMLKCVDTVEKIHTPVNHVWLKTPHAFAVTVLNGHYSIKCLSKTVTETDYPF